MREAQGEKWKGSLAQLVLPGLCWEVEVTFRNSCNSMKKFANLRRIRSHKRGSIDRAVPRPTRQRSKELNLPRFFSCVNN